MRIAILITTVLCGCAQPPSDADVYRLVIEDLTERVPIAFRDFCVSSDRTYTGEVHDPGILELFDDLGLTIWSGEGVHDRSTHIALISPIRRDSTGLQVFASVDEYYSDDQVAWLEFTDQLQCDEECVIHNVSWSEGDGALDTRTLELVESGEAPGCHGDQASALRAN